MNVEATVVTINSLINVIPNMAFNILLVN